MDDPRIPAIFSSVTELGVPRRYFRSRGSNRVGSVLALIVSLVGALLALLYGAYQAFWAYQSHGPAALGAELTWPVVIALVLFLFGLLAARAVSATRKKGIVLYEQGFAVRARKGPQAWRWEGVAALTTSVTRHYFGGFHTRTTHRYTLQNWRNEQLLLNDGYEKVEELAKSIEENIFPLLYHRAAEQYNAGQTLVFGPVAIAAGGVRIGKKIYPWTNVKEVSVHHGRVKISRKDGGWFSGASAEVASIPNLNVLLSIIQQVVGLKAG